jgi:hypothetical protein
MCTGCVGRDAERLKAVGEKKARGTGERDSVLIMMLFDVGLFFIKLRRG